MRRRSSPGSSSPPPAICVGECSWQEQGEVVSNPMNRHHLGMAVIVHHHRRQTQQVLCIQTHAKARPFGKRG